MSRLPGSPSRGTSGCLPSVRPSWLASTRLEPCSEIAEEYGINRRTVGEIVARHGCLSRAKLTNQQIDDAVAAYLEGQSLATIPKQLGVCDHTVRSRLKERGINMRPAHGDVTVSEPTTGDCPLPKA